MERISTGNREADLILNGGVPSRSISIIMGQPGAGKTVFAQQLAFACADGERPVLYLSTVSEPQAKIITYLQELAFADQEKIGTQVVYDTIADALTADPLKLGEKVLELLKTHRPRILIIDSFKAIADLMPDMAAWRRVLYEVAGLLTAYDTTSFWIGEYDAATISELPEFAIADGILELSREQRGTRDDRYFRVVKLRGSGFLDGLHFFTISSAGLAIHPRLTSPSIAPDYTPKAERLASGVGQLDAMIESGWLRGTTTLVAGPSGAGKTVIGLHFLREGIRQGEPGLLIAFQENPTQIARIMRNFGWQLEGLLGDSQLDLLYCSSVELQIDTLVTEVFRRIKTNGVRRVVVDALGDVEKSARDTVRFRDYLYALSQHFAVENVTSMFLLETAGRAAEYQGLSGREISYISDNTVLLEMQLGDELTRTIRILKSRGSAHDGKQHKLRITASGIAVE